MKTGRRLPKISVIIPTRDDENVIEETLKCLRKAYPRKKMEIIVVDYSNDSTKRIARKYANVISARRPGKAYALNLGVKKAKNDLVYFLDADSLVKKDTIKRLVSVDGTVAGLSMPVNKGGLAARISRLELAFYNCLEIGIEGLLSTALVASKNLMIKKDDIKKAGGFSSLLTEDLNFSMKLYRIGERIKLVPAYCFEQVPDKLRYYWGQQERWFLGTSDEIRRYIKTLSFLELVVFLPYLILRAMTPTVSLILLILFLIFGNYFLLAGALIGILVLFAACVRFLERDDIAMFPLILFIYAVIDLMLVINIFLNLNKKRTWVKTPKQRYGPSKPHLGQT